MDYNVVWLRYLGPVWSLVETRLGFPCGSASKESTCHVGNLGLILGLGRSPGEEMATHYIILA